MSYKRQSNPLQNAAVGSLYGLGIGALTGNAGRGAAIGALSGLALGGVGRDIGLPGFSGGKSRKRVSRRKTPSRRPFKLTSRKRQMLAKKFKSLSRGSTVSLKTGRKTKHYFRSPTVTRNRHGTLFVSDPVTRKSKPISRE